MTTSSYESLSHSKWDCKYHVVFIPKGRKKALYGKIRGFLGPVLRELAGQRGSTILEGHRVQDHVHMLIRIPPTYAVAEVMGSIKGKSAIAVARQCGGRQTNSAQFLVLCSASTLAEELHSSSPFASQSRARREAVLGPPRIPTHQLRPTTKSDKLSDRRE